MWPFKKPTPRFQIGDRVFFQIIAGGNVYPGVVVGYDGERRNPYVVQNTWIPEKLLDTPESKMWPRALDAAPLQLMTSP